MDETLFPHEHKREVQEEFLNDAVRALNNDKHFIAHAPTGLGKTTILGPALYYALRKKKTLFFLTPRHTQHKVAVETLRLIKEKHNMDITSVDFIGKRWMCRQPGVQAMTSGEFAEYCSDMVEKGNCEYYNNVRKKGKATPETQLTLKRLKDSNPSSVEDACKTCGEARLCPYEVSCLLAQKAEVIICDYFHVLSGHVRDAFFKKMNKDLSESILIFDEAHNLPAKTRDLLTANLSTFTLEYAAKEAFNMGYEETSEKIRKIKRILEKFTKDKTSIERQETLITKEELKGEIEAIEEYLELESKLHQIGAQALEVKKKSATKTAAGFLTSWLGPDDGFARILKKGFTRKGEAYISLSYRCLDPSITMKPIAEQARVICMSGTMSPVQMYKDLLGFEAETMEYSDPFPKQNRLSIIVPKTTTKFTERDPEMWQKIAAVTANIANAIPGNTAIFFPSYYVRDNVNEHFERQANKTIFLEHPNMSKEERDEMIETYKGYKSRGAVLLGVSSGSFSEGIDLPGDLLKAVIVVGLPLAKPDLETKELIDYYDRRFGKGWDYGYIYPAMIKTIQSAGRCIRSENDKGVIVFLDERYQLQNYYRCFPKDWRIQTTRMPIALIEDFFKRQEAELLKTKEDQE